MAKQQQNTTNVNIPEEDIIEDEYYQEPNYMEEDETGGDEEVKKLSSKINLSKNGMLIALGVVAVLIAVVLFTGKLPIPKLSLGGGGDADSGIASGLLGSYDEAAESEGGEEGGAGEDNLVDLIIKDLKDYYPDYDITNDEELEQIVAVGTMEDGQAHKLVLDYNGETVEELIGDSAIVETADGTIVEEPATPAQTEGQAQAQPDTVQVPLSEYNKYPLSKKAQPFDDEAVAASADDEYYDEEFTPSVETTTERLIVEYERLPIKGTTAMVYSKALETGEEIIFAVTLRQYANLGPKGTTVVELTRSTGYGVKTIDKVNLVKWKE
ncbi:MAG: hypothetical protein ABS904_01015 [Solibacillus isronensis]